MNKQKELSISISKLEKVTYKTRLLTKLSKFANSPFDTQIKISLTVPATISRVGVDFSASPSKKQSWCFGYSSASLST